MLKRFKIELNGNNNAITIPITTNYSTKLNDFDAVNIDDYINSIDDFEKESFSSINDYKLIFNFFDDNKTPKYNDQWEWAGFNMSTDFNKNIFKKSLFLLEFYNKNDLDGANMEFATTLNVNPNQKTHKGSDITVTGNTINYFSSYTINDYRNELYDIFYNRNIKNSSNLIFDNNQKLYYVKLYMKSMFLNAKTGLVQYFINEQININVTNDMFFYEIRFYENYTYAFFKNNILQTEVILNEY